MALGIEWLQALRPKDQVGLLRGWQIASTSSSDLPSQLLAREYDCHREFIYDNFIWKRTPEGSEYWLNIALASYVDPIYYVGSRPDGKRARYQLLSHFLNRDTQFAILKNAVNVDKKWDIAKWLIESELNPRCLLQGAFVWIDSPEGYRHWADIFDLIDVVK